MDFAVGLICSTVPVSSIMPVNIVGKLAMKQDSVEPRFVNHHTPFAMCESR
jgi:hypothetical protein